jgi:hypothetical protein
MGLFDKKFCDICHNKIGLLGNRKLENGNLCKDCAAKLSPWFNERRQSTVEDIRAQLQYREENKAEVANFHTTRSLGGSTKVLLDEDARKFMVTSARNIMEANPDVLDYSQVTGCNLDVQEHRTELKHNDKDGRPVSFIPPRYEYSYDFHVNIRVNHPYFDTMSLRLNPSAVKVGQQPIGNINRHNAGTNASIIKGQIVSNVLGVLAGQGTGTVASWNPQYNEYYNMGQEIVNALTQVREDVRQEIQARNAPKMAVTCPWCGATTMPDAAGCCEYCGGALNG